MHTLSPENLIAIDQLTPLLVKHNLPVDMFDTMDRKNEYRTAKLFAMDVLQLCGLNETEAKTVVHGIEPNTVKADLEGFGGWNDCYDWYIAHNTLEAYTDIIIKNDTTISVGMKYPTFNAPRFIKKYKLTFVGCLQTVRDIEWVKTHPTSTIQAYDTYIDPKGNVYSFEPDAIGKGGYAGFIFKDIKTAMKFVNTYLNVKSNYVKDINIINNGLGGIDKNDIIYHSDLFITHEIIS